jgi:hypothetical protein
MLSILQVVIDLDIVEEPMIADQMLIMLMFLKDIHTIHDHFILWWN